MTLCQRKGTLPYILFSKPGMDFPLKNLQQCILSTFLVQIRSQCLVGWCPGMFKKYILLCNNFEKVPVYYVSWILKTLNVEINYLHITFTRKNIPWDTKVWLNYSANLSSSIFQFSQWKIGGRGGLRFLLQGRRICIMWFSHFV